MWVDGAAVRQDGVTNYHLDEKLALQELNTSVESYYDGIE